MSQPIKGKNLKLAPHFFEYEGSSNLNIEPRAAYHFILSKVVAPAKGGVERHFKDCKYPMKGFPFYEAMWAMDIVKKYTMVFIMTFSSKDLLLPFIAFAILPKKIKMRFLQKFLERYVILADYTLCGVYLKHQYYSECPKAIWKLIDVFLEEYGISGDLSHKVGKVFATLIEYDDAYRYRIEDAMSEVSFELMYDNPRKGIQKIAEIFEQRDKQVGFKFLSFAKILGILLLLPSVKRSFKTALNSILFSDLQLDDIDRYHCHLRTGYNFFGMTDDERIDRWYEMHDGMIPEQIEILS